MDEILIIIAPFQHEDRNRCEPKAIASFLATLGETRFLGAKTKTYTSLYGTERLSMSRIRQQRIRPKSILKRTVLPFDADLRRRISG
jgi:hypothetical protein